MGHSEWRSGSNVLVLDSLRSEVRDRRCDRPETCCEAWLIDYVSIKFKPPIHILPFIGVHACAARSAPPPCNPDTARPRMCCSRNLLLPSSDSFGFTERAGVNHKYNWESITPKYR